MKDIWKASSKAALTQIGNLIPIVGFAKDVYENLSQIQAERKIHRLECLLEDLNYTVFTLQERLNAQFVSQEDFVDVFEKASRYVANERNEYKRKCFRNILLNSMLAQECDYDRTERFCRILDNLNYDDMRVLSVLSNPVSYNRKNGMIIKDPQNNQFITHWVRATAENVLCQLLKMEDYEIRESVNYLFNNGLVCENLLNKAIETNSNPVFVLNGSLSRRGQEFVAYIQDC